MTIRKFLSMYVGNKNNKIHIHIGNGIHTVTHGFFEERALEDAPITRCKVIAWDIINNELHIIAEE